MTIQERAEQANPYSPGVPQYEPWNEGYTGAVNGEEWKNLYAEGLEVGMGMLRDGSKAIAEGYVQYLIDHDVVVPYNHLLVDSWEQYEYYMKTKIK